MTYMSLELIQELCLDSLIFLNVRTVFDMNV